MSRPRKKFTADFINDVNISDALRYGQLMATERNYLRSLINKAIHCTGLAHNEAAALLHVQEEEMLEEIYAAAAKVKDKIYGNRIVLFAPLNVDSFPRRKMNMDELKEEVRALLRMGHKRLTLEAGDHPANSPIDYILQCIDTIYSVKEGDGSIRRVNVNINIAAAKEEDYKKLIKAGIGTYITNQQTYHRSTYERMHPTGMKQDYDWHTTAMDRALRAGMENVGVGVLYGLYDYKYETVALLMHTEHMEKSLGIGPRTVSIARLRSAEGADPHRFPTLVSDRDFMKVMAVLRLAIPYAGIVLSAREMPEFHDQAMRLAVTQMSVGSCTGISSCAGPRDPNGSPDGIQFEACDSRSPLEIIKNICKSGYVPSYCTACYREGRTGSRFMRLAKSGQIHHVCQPNSLLTFKEYLLDYGDEEAAELGEQVIKQNLQTMPKESARKSAAQQLLRIEAGERDLRF